MRRLLLSLSILLSCFGLISALGILPSSTLSREGGSTCSKVPKAWAAEEGASKSAKEEAKGEAETAKQGEAEGEAGEKKQGEPEKEHEGSVPIMYFVQWAVLFSAFGLGLGYVYRVRTQGKSQHEGIKLAYALAILVLAYFALNYYPTLAEYHEPSLASLIKFFLLLITGALVTLYGVLGRHDEI